MTVGIGVTPANAILDAFLRSTTWTEPAAVYVKLHLGDPGAAGAANAAAETTRKQATFGAASGGAATTTADILWTNVAATETVTHVSFWDASSGGNFLGSDALDSSVSLTAGESAIILAGNLDFAITPIAA